MVVVVVVVVVVFLMMTVKWYLAMMEMEGEDAELDRNLLISVFHVRQREYFQVKYLCEQIQQRAGRPLFAAVAVLLI